MIEKSEYYLSFPYLETPFCRGLKVAAKEFRKYSRGKRISYAEAELLSSIELPTHIENRALSEYEF